ncbi:MAG: hypothetical protein DRP56_08600 [Planctomycetota bacterium]|nr:MAG: hypothetical protein DRP56_08600 [Planctomycetota bacterium]
MTESIQQAGIISDADVLIDYAKSAPHVLRLISAHIKKLYVALSVVKEVDQLDTADIEKLDIEIITPSFAQIVEAEQIRKDKPSISGRDAISFVLARDHNWACLTNDKALRSYCRDQKITCLWGIGMMRHLVDANKLTPQKALRIAQDIQSKNRRITPEIIKRFTKQLGLQ